MKKVCYCSTCDKFGFKDENDNICLKCNSPLTVTKYTESYYEGLNYEEKLKLKDCVRRGEKYKEPEDPLVTTLPYIPGRTIVKTEPFFEMIKDDYQRCDFGKKRRRNYQKPKKEAVSKEYDAILNLKIEYRDFYSAGLSGFSAGLNGVIIPQYYKIYVSCEFAKLSS